MAVTNDGVTSKYQFLLDTSQTAGLRMEAADALVEHGIPYVNRGSFVGRHRCQEAVDGAFEKHREPCG